MAQDPTVWDDVLFLRGEKVEAVKQVTFAYDGKLYETTLCADNLLKLGKALGPFITAARDVPSVKIPALPAHVDVTDRLTIAEPGPEGPPIEDRAATNGAVRKETASVPLKKTAAGQLDRLLPNGKQAPAEFWRDQPGDSQALKAKKKETRVKIKKWSGAPRLQGPVSPAVAYAWAYEHPTEIPKK